MGFERGFSPLVGSNPAVETALSPLTGERAMVASLGDMVVSDLFLGNVRFVPLL